MSRSWNIEVELEVEVSQHKRYSENVKVELDLHNYARKTDLNWAAGVNTSDLAAKPDLASLKAHVGKIKIKIK